MIFLLLEVKFLLNKLSTDYPSEILILIRTVFKLSFLKSESKIILFCVNINKMP